MDSNHSFQPNDTMVDTLQKYSSLKRVQFLLGLAYNLDPSDVSQEQALRRLARFLGAEIGIMEVAAPLVIALARQGCRLGTEFTAQRVDDEYVVQPVEDSNHSFQPKDTMDTLQTYSSLKRVQFLLGLADNLDPSDVSQEPALWRLAPFLGAEIGIMEAPAPMVIALARKGCRLGTEFTVQRVGDEYVVQPVEQRGNSSSV